MYKIIIPVMGYSELFRITHYRNNNLIEKHRRTSGANNLFAPDVLRHLKNDFKMKFSHVSLFVDLSDYSDLNQLNVSRNLSSFASPLWFTAKPPHISSWIAVVI